MTNNLNIAIIQSDLVWENPERNRLHFTEKIDAISDRVDLIILPEMFTSGFTMQPKNVSETMDGKSIEWLKESAIKNNIAIAGSLVIEEGGNYFNRLVFVYPNGHIETYDKRHTFTLAGEHVKYTPGSHRLIVNYKGFKADIAAFDAYLKSLADNPVQSSWTREEKMAYWINAYNAFTVKLIIDNYPLKSIKDLNSTIAIPTVSTIWAKKWFTLGGKEMSLDNIEQGILRPNYNDARIHAALNCASVSCPPLRPEAFTAAKLDKQLDEQMRFWLADNSRNIVSANKLQLSKIFNWYGGDFEKEGSKISFIQRFTDVQIAEDADISYLDYDWNLNKQ